MQYASQNLIPVTLELGGKSPNIFFADVVAEDDDFFDKAIEGFVMFALNQGEVCTCPSRALIHESIYDRFMERATQARRGDHPGLPARSGHDDRRAGLVRAAREDPDLRRHRPPGRRRVLTGGERNDLPGDLGRRLLRQADGVQGPQQDAHLPGGDLRPRPLGHDLQGRRRRALDRQRHALRPRRRRLDPRREPRLPLRPRHPGGRVWTNCYHAYPAHAAFGGYKQSGIGRENHKMMLDHYQQTKNLLVSYSPKKLGFF